MSRRSVSVLLQRSPDIGRLLKSSLIQKCANFEIRYHEIWQSIESRASSVANERLCMGTPKLNPEMPSKAPLSGSSAIAHLYPPTLPPPSLSCLPRSPSWGSVCVPLHRWPKRTIRSRKATAAPGSAMWGGGGGGGGGEVGGTAAPQLQLLCVGGDERRAGSDERRTALQRGG